MKPQQVITVTRAVRMEDYQTPYHYLANAVVSLKKEYPEITDKDIKVSLSKGAGLKGVPVDLIAMVTVKDPKYEEKMKKWEELQELKERVKTLEIEMIRN